MPAYADNIVPTDPETTEANTPESWKNRGIPSIPEIDVVVSGMSGRFPESESIDEFCKNLFEGVDMVTEDDRRWTPGLFGLPRRSGKLKDLSQFDASYFGVSPRQAHCMDPQLRILLEAAHEAVLDAGIHPNEIRGKKVGVYVGVSESESSEYLTMNPDAISGYELTGCCRAMFANRLSFSMDLKGPSFAVDTACSSALVALQNAWVALKNGEIEGAIVAGSNLNLKPVNSLQFHSLSMLSMDGKCKAFDASGNGYVRSEAVVAVYLQRANDARRVYAHILQARTNTDGSKGEGITFPSGEVQKQLLQEVYERAKIDPASVSYVEAHGTGTKAGDPQELNAIAEVLCQNRTTPLLMGSVKSNMGHSESASGLCSLVKVLISMQKQEIPGNLHFKEPNPNIPALNDGSIHVISQNTEWKGKYAALNCFGFGGANVHMLLQAPMCVSTPPPSPGCELTTSEIPRLILGSGRTDEATELFLKQSSNRKNRHLSTLVDHLATSAVNTHPYRGYTIFPQTLNSEETTITRVSECISSNKPVWFVFSGMGSQWKGCGTRLLAIPTFAAAINKCNGALSPYGVNVIDVITNDPLTSTTKSFVAIAAVQVGLVEVLKSIGLGNFDGVVGHSVGELGCGYADGALTAEQTVLAAYWRGKAVEEADLPPGGMAALGLSAEEAQKWCGNGPVVVACHNSTSSVTISGPKDEVEKLQEKITAQDIFCRSVNSGGVAFHHSSLKKAAPRLLAELKSIITVPRRRTSRWISSSMTEKDWNSSLAQSASPEYLVNNLVSPVLFAQALTKVPEGALVVEIAPHSLMQAVLRRALPSATQVPLVRKEARDALTHLFEGIGKIYVAGQKVDILSLYPQPQLPVPVTTPSIAGMIRWDHQIEWDVAKFSGKAASAEFKVDVDINSQEFEYIEGHTIDGRVLFPATGYLALVWKALAKLTEAEWENLPVTFTNVTLHHATVLSSSNPVVSFTVRILTTKGDFEVLSGESVAVSGTVQIGVKSLPEKVQLIETMQKVAKKADKAQTISLKKSEVYKELKLRGYHYGGLFQGVESADLKGSHGKLEWKSNWVSLLDTMLQFSLLGAQTRGLYLPTRIRKMTIEPSEFLESLKGEDEKKIAEVIHNRCLSITMCKGVEIHGLKATLAPRRTISDEPLLESYQFFPRNISANSKISMIPENAVKLIVDQVIENSPSMKLRILHLYSKVQNTSSDESTFIPRAVLKAGETHPLLAIGYSLQTKDPITTEKEVLESAGVEIVDKIDEGTLSKLDLMILTGGFEEKNISNYVQSCKENTFVLCNKEEACEKIKKMGFIVVASVETNQLFLLRKPYTEQSDEVMEIDCADKEYKWVEPLKQKLLSAERKPLWLTTRGEHVSGLLGMFNCLKRETGGSRLRCIMKEGDITDADWKILRSTNFILNVFQNGEWGTMRHLTLPPLSTELKGQAYLNVLTRGDLASLTWLRASQPSKEEGLIISTIHYAPLNFRDIMLATGKLPPDALPGNLANKDCVLGLEFAGTSEKHGRVMGLVDAGGLATSVQSDPLLTWTVPDSWTLKDAATVPVVYSTAYYALVVRGGLKQGESVLIHAGSGGVGQAAISIALHRGCQVFTTVSSTKKREFLKSKFPQLTDFNFSNSRDGSFEFDILERTGGEGVDVVLNSLAGELLQASVRCLKEHGRFLEIGKADLANNTGLGMSVFLKNVTFHGILLDALFHGPGHERKGLQTLLYDGIRSGEVTPLPFTAFKWDEAEDAFRFMATGKHIGKVILEVIPEETAKPVPENSKIPSVFRLWPKDQSVFVITGGLGGLGLEIADWLIGRGAKNIVLTSRRGVSTGYQAICVQRWKSAGANIQVICQDASTIDGAEALLKQSSNYGTIAGIFHLAMILEDSMIENQTSGSFQRVNHVKAEGAIALDAASRRLCPDLEFWVTFSSVACGRGNPGQSNYGWANSLSERIVERRVQDGLPGLAIQFGGIGDVGVLASTLGEIEVGGTKPQSVRSVLACLDDLIGSKSPVVSSLCLATKKSGSGGKGGKSLLASIANVLGIRDLKKAPMNVSLGDLGLDSLMAVEVKQTLEREKDMVLSTEEIRELTLTRLQQIESADVSADNGSHDKEKKQLSAHEIFPWIDFPLVPTETFKVLKDSFDPNHIPLFIASPIQGCGEPLQEVVSQLNGSVIAMQYTEALNTESVVDLATSLSELMEVLQPTGPIHLAGYSFGACVACEIAHQMEKKGRQVEYLILLDGSQSYVASIIENYRNKFEKESKETVSTEISEHIEVQGEIECLLMYAMQLCNVDRAALKSSLRGCKTFEERKKLMAKVVMETVGPRKNNNMPLEEKHITTGADMFYRKLKAGFYHNATELKISAKTMLLRASENTYSAAFGEDYGLSDVLKGELSIHEVHGSHESFIVGESAKEVAKYINQFTQSHKNV